MHVLWLWLVLLWLVLLWLVLLWLVLVLSLEQLFFFGSS